MAGWYRTDEQILNMFADIIDFNELITHDWTTYIGEKEAHENHIETQPKTNNMSKDEWIRLYKQFNDIAIITTNST